MPVKTLHLGLAVDGNRMETEKHYISAKTIIDENVILESPIRTYGSVRVKKGCKIGGYTFINDFTALFPGTKIGRFCSIGKKCEIGAYDHPIDWLSTSPFQYNDRHFSSFPAEFAVKKFKRPPGVVIGNDVWVGSLTIIKRGVTIGDGAIIGGGSIVVKDVPPYAIVGGVPAKLIRYRFPPEIIQRLLRVKWWNRPNEDLAELPFDDIEKALELLEEAPPGQLESTTHTKERVGTAH